jgi:F1F0 ATPase subunit 2
MIAFHLTLHELVLSAGWLATGLVIGAIQFLSLRWNVRMLAAGRSPLRIVAVQLGRFAGLAAFLAIITHTFGALSLFTLTLGILTARSIIVRREA